MSIVRLSKDKFVTGCMGQTIRVWNGMTGECIETIASGQVQGMARVGDYFITVDTFEIKAWRLRFALSSSAPLSFFLSVFLSFFLS